MSRLVWKSLVAIAASAALFSAGTARAEITPPTTGMGDKGQLWIDQISGFRVSANGGLNYYGPIGFSVTSIGEDCLGPPGCNSSNTLHQTTFWLAPSADIFVIDHLSVGGLLEFSTTSSSTDFNQGGTIQTTSNPTTTNFTFLPRVGWMFGLSDRFGIWPRLGIGYAARQVDLPPNGTLVIRDSIQGVILDLDVGFIFRLTDSFFLKAAPEISFLPGGSHSETINNTSSSANANAFQFAGVTGIGAILDL